MNFPAATFRGNSIPLSHCSSCCDLRFQPFASSSTNSRQKQRNLKINQISCSRLVFRRKREFICRGTETETEPDSNDDKEKKQHEEGEMPATNSTGSEIDSLPIVVDQDKEQPVVLEMLDSENLANNSGAEIKPLGSSEGTDNVEVASGSPLPGVKPQQLDELIMIPKETIDVLRDQVFGFDTFFVTGQEPYEGGVLFKGNLRGQAARSYEKITKRIQDKFGDQYKLFLLINPEDDKPVAVVVPRKTLQPETTAVPEWFAAGAFGLVTVFTLLLRNVPALQSNLLSTFDNLDSLKDGLPGALVTALVLGAHEISHILVARSSGIKLGLPYFVPSWQVVGKDPMAHLNFQEGQSTSRPPLLIGSENFNFWKFRMKIFLKRDPWEWWVVENGPVIPRHDDGKPKALMEMDANESYMFSYNSRAMNTLLSGMVQVEIDKVSSCNTAKEMWDTILTSHEGTSKVKEVKLSMLMQDYELFKLEKDETINEAQGRFLTLMNSLSMLDRKIDQREINRKILRVMPKRFASKVTTLQDSPTISTMETLTLFGELEEFENQLNRYDEEDEAPIKKTLAFQVESNNKSDYEDFDEEIEMLSRKLERLLQRKKQRKNKKGSSTPVSKSETKQEEETVQLCFMGLKDDDQLEIGSFGAITRILNIVPKREDLLKVAIAGPLAGFSLGLVLLLLGFFLPPSDGIGVIVDASVFHESLLAGGLAKLLFGDVLKEGTQISVNPLVLWAWAGLLINAINSIPAGELDGGRIAFAIWGRKASARFTGASIVLLGLSSLFNDVAFYWVALIFFLQRGPIAPLSEEITGPDNEYVALGVTVLLLGLLVCLPYPLPFSSEAMTSF